ncbi:MAG: hypothetical protein R3F60_18615 [bacterium]
MTRSVALRLGVLVAGTMLSGCAWTFMTPPPAAGDERSYRPGSAQGWLGGVDAAFAALSVVGAVAGLQRPDAAGEVVGNLLFAGLHTASAVTGFGWAEECVAVESRLGQRLDEGPFGDPPPVARLRAPECQADDDCKGDRICNDGRCHSP